MPIMRGRPIPFQAVYTSATIVASSNSGILAFADQISAQWNEYIHYCWSWQLVGANIAGGETVDVTMDFYTNSAGTGGTLGTITFNQLTAGSPNDLEMWPGDITAFTVDTPVPPYFKLTWTISGGASLNFVLYGNFWRLE